MWANYPCILPAPTLAEQGKELTLRWVFKMRENCQKSRGSDKHSRWKDWHRNREALSIISGDQWGASLALTWTAGETTEKVLQDEQSDAFKTQRRNVFKSQRQTGAPSGF